MKQTTEQLRALAVLADAEYMRAKALATRARRDLDLLGILSQYPLQARARQTASEATAAHKAAKHAWGRVIESKFAKGPSVC